MNMKEIKIFVSETAETHTRLYGLDIYKVKGVLEEIVRSGRYAKSVRTKGKNVYEGTRTLENKEFTFFFGLRENDKKDVYLLGILRTTSKRARRGERRR
nr:hypothetical protein [Candidatus Freyarchaeota archaeon]